MKSCQARDEEIRTLFLSGETLQKIGDRFGVSRERVRQILRRIGISSDEGGSHIGVVHRNAERRRRHEEKREARISDTYGCTYAEFLEANEGKLANHPGSFAQRYKSQKHSAHARGVAWQISLPEWKGMWLASGHWDDRKKGGYVMARRGDSGPYAIWNVRICTSSENIKEGYVFRKGRRSKAA